MRLVELKNETDKRHNQFRQFYYSGGVWPPPAVGPGWVRNGRSQRSRPTWSECDQGIIDCTYQGIDFAVPAGWLKDVPRTIVISFYYPGCREQQVIEKIFIPHEGRRDRVWAVWLRPYCEQKLLAGCVPVYDGLFDRE